MNKTYTLYIKAYSPTTIPMARLAEYMYYFAGMLGHESAVHFDRLDGGSTKLISCVDFEDIPKVRADLDAVARGEAEPEHLKAREAIDKLLADDNATGSVYEDNNETAEIIAFPGVTRQRPVKYGPFKQEGTIDGVLVSIGGTDKTIHIRLQNGDIKYSNIDTNRETARRLGKHLFEPVRVFGTGTWLREEDGSWTLKRFKVQSYEVLEDSDLRNVIDDMRTIEGSDWADMDDPLEAIKKLRDEGSGPH